MTRARTRTRTRTRTHTHTHTHAHAHTRTYTHTPDETLTCHMRHRSRAQVRTDIHLHANYDECPKGHGVLSAPVVAIRVVLRVVIAAIVVAASIVRRRVPQHRGSHGVEWSVPHVEQLRLLKRLRVSPCAAGAGRAHSSTLTTTWCGLLPRLRQHAHSTLRAARDRPQFSHDTIPGAQKRRRTCRSSQARPSQQGPWRPRRQRPPSALHIEHTATAHIASGPAQHGGP
jgi:hypothetical protein